jgi:pimeloyl-ACP methyl ester carboxylesterase
VEVRYHKSYSGLLFFQSFQYLHTGLANAKQLQLSAKPNEILVNDFNQLRNTIPIEKGSQQMAVKTANSKVQATTAAQAKYTTSSVISKDGATIGYRQIGHGPGVVVVHGAMESAQSHMQLAEALADSFTVYLPDRRGRGMSGVFGEGYSVQKDVEDMEALLTKTGAHFVFGVSSGAIITLNAARSLPAIHKAAIFEPPLVINGVPSMDFLVRYDAEIMRGDIAGALVTGMIGAQMGPPIFNKIPRWILKLLTRTMMDKQFSPDDLTMRTLAPTLHYDFQLVNEMTGKLESFKDITADMLLLNGTASPAYLQESVDTLAKMFPQAKRVEFAGLGHGASGPTQMGGKPDVVAETLRGFLG